MIVLPLLTSTNMSALAKTYRVYRFDIERRQVSADFVNALNDDEVIGKAKSEGFGSKYEIWDGKRLVARFASEHNGA